MGDRGNIVIESRGSNIYFYSHWTGSELPAIVAEGLSNGESRWGDAPYLNRVLFCTLVKDDVDGETGYGIDTEMGDGGTEVYVNHDTETVRYRNEELPFDAFIEKYHP